MMIEGYCFYELKSSIEPSSKRGGIGVLNLGVEIIRKLMVEERPVTLEEFARGYSFYEQKCS